MSGAFLNSSGSSPKICAVIPTFNENNKLRETVIQTKKFIETVIVVDDGSTDESISLVEKIDNVKIVSHEKNLGKGAALATGLSFAKKSEFDFAVTLDADLQHDPGSIPKFLVEAEKGNYDIVIGNRLGTTKDMPLPRIASNFLTSKLLSIKTGKKILDSQSGFRLYKLERIEKILPAFNGFEAESEMLVYAAKNKMEFGFVEIPTIYNDNESKMKSIQAIIGFIKVLFI